MKKIVLFSLLTLILQTAYADTCPPVNTLFQVQNGKYVLVAPAGWNVADDESDQDEAPSFKFSVGAWGNHSKTSDSVRCHYYDNNEKHIQLNSFAQFTEAAFTSHPEWSDYNLYRLCTHSTSVTGCPYN
jgi:hypothetical protein